MSSDPAMGEYLTADRDNAPGMGGVFNSRNLQTYHYAGNNPIKYTDPTGEYDVDYFTSAEYEEYRESFYEQYDGYTTEKERWRELKYGFFYTISKLSEFGINALGAYGVASAIKTKNPTLIGLALLPYGLEFIKKFADWNLQQLILNPEDQEARASVLASINVYNGKIEEVQKSLDGVNKRIEDELAKEKQNKGLLESLNEQKDEYQQRIDDLTKERNDLEAGVAEK
ncbi:hypothetical protein PVA45_06040 [Entomospira entomophila]|uniref:RHS repeat-associated core domain-containing protein n=1 Tax=Entomospira entomophila TaxID=2719988 RepID=A0A968GEN3_9SPIO|nr:hypothetical protein [Entomospira entomophilus]NIZ41059.1 hypothetical protein [Entomospira entomophilus]WDI35268.1 hypothetical protein PVA45_06040 [Entomospira entomophilus]